MCAIYGAKASAGVEAHHHQLGGQEGRTRPRSPQRTPAWLGQQHHPTDFIDTPVTTMRIVNQFMNDSSTAR